ncbi:MAG: DUF11 domain-containing protein [Ruminococcaceae bacterium]|nr:DUF11 domain-containing protein [Oscillospiraceae bacterium]
MATFFNQATLTYSGGTVNSNVTAGELVEVLSVNKTAVAQTYAQGDEITYAVNLINTGTAPLTGLTVTDDLGAYAFDTQTLVPLVYIADSVKVFADGVPQATPAVTEGAPLVIDGITVPADGVTTVLYTVRVNSFAAPTGTGLITNTVTVSGGVTPVTASETITAAEEPALTITKAVSPTTVSENGELTYTFVIQNNGNTAAEAADAIVITDTFDPILSNITVTYNGAVWSEPASYTYNEATGEFATVAGAVTVPAATFTQDPVTGAWTATPGEATLTVTGTV